MGLLAFGVISEQIKTRRELAELTEGSTEVAGAPEVVTPEGLRYRDLRVGGGATPQRGLLIVMDYKAFADGEAGAGTERLGAQAAAGALHVAAGRMGCGKGAACSSATRAALQSG